MHVNLEPYNFTGSLISRQPSTLNLSLRKHKKARSTKKGLHAELNLVGGLCHGSYEETVVVGNNAISRV